MPASNPKAIEKARTLACDVVILDLEDAVAPDAKEAARANAVEAVSAGGFGTREVVIRINGADTPWGEHDLKAVLSARPDALLVPKVNTAGDIEHYQEAIKDADLDLWVMIETTQAMFNLYNIALMAPVSRLACFVMGTNDFAKEIGAHLVPGREPMIGLLGLAVAAAKSQQLSILDGVFNDLEDEEGMARECAQGRNFGFDGKTLIHPKQLDRCNASFTPSEAEIAFAKAVVAAFILPENSNRGAIRVVGKMVERLHLRQAERLLAIAAAIAAA